MTVASELLTSKQLQDRLEIDSSQLGELLRAGLPCEGKGRGRRFDLATVESWLIENGHAEIEPSEPAPDAAPSDGAIARTRAEAARLLGLGLDGERTISKWLKMPGFPGRSGTPGKQDGEFPIEPIRTWLAAQGMRGNYGADDALRVAKNRLALLEIEREERRTREELGQLVDVNDISRFFEQCVTNAKAVLGQIPDEVLADVQSGVPPEQIHRKVQRRIDEAYLEIAQLLEGDTDPTSDDEELADGETNGKDSETNDQEGS